jgi:hypothetical protein
MGLTIVHICSKGNPGFPKESCPPKQVQLPGTGRVVLFQAILYIVVQQSLQKKRL